MANPDEIITILCRRGQSPTGIPGKQFTTQVKLSVAGPDYALSFGFDRALLDRLKSAIPQSEMTWHKTRKVWLVHPDEIDKAIEVIKAHTGQVITLPETKPTVPEVIEKTFLLEYLGATKDRGKRISAYGSVKGEWSAEFPEDVLKNFFEGGETNQKPDGLQTLYQVLCVLEKATPEEIKKAYWRLARICHPDVNHEEGAAERFIKIRDAYEILSNPEKKKRYDAGLYFERQEQDQGSRVIANHKYGYRSPLTCGRITARGTVRLMRFTINEILTWDDVVNEQGKIMVTSWRKGADHFTTEWV